MDSRTPHTTRAGHAGAALAALALLGAAAGPSLAVTDAQVQACIRDNLVRYSQPANAAGGQYVDIEAACVDALTGGGADVTVTPVATPRRTTPARTTTSPADTPDEPPEPRTTTTTDAPTTTQGGGGTSTSTAPATTRTTTTAPPARTAPRTRTTVPGTTTGVPVSQVAFVRAALDESDRSAGLSGPGDLGAMPWPVLLLLVLTVAGTAGAVAVEVRRRRR